MPISRTNAKGDKGDGEMSREVFIKCACGHETLVSKPHREKDIELLADRWADMLCPLCDEKGNDDMDFCSVHNKYFAIGQTCWKCNYKRGR